MPDTEYKRLIDSARERALFGFLAMVQRAMQDADKNLAQQSSAAKSHLEHTTLSSLRHFLRQDGSVFLRRIDALYRAYLERAMQTMYVDLRPGMRKMSIDELALIDDEVVNHQIEVGRLAARMRDADEECIGRLNVIIAQLHGETEARERENPFRPYLLARALYEAIHEVTSDETRTRLLFEHLSTALIEHLPGYYGAIREVFEASGVHGKFVAQPSRAAHNQRYFGAPAGPPVLPPRAEAHMAPALQRMLDMLPPAGTGDAAGQPAMMQEFIRKMFSSARPPAPPAEAREGMPNPLAAQLDQYQKSAARGQPLDSTAQAGENQLFLLRDKLDLDQASVMERMTVEVVAMLFEFILGDPQIPAESRRQIARLQVPVLRAAMIEPDLLHEAGHPVRALLNRLGSAALAADPGTDAGRKLNAEIGRITGDILAGFDSDMSLFADSLRQFEQFLGEHLRRDDRATTQAIEAVELAEKISVLLTNVTNALCETLRPLNADKRISDFIIHVWPHVLVHAAWRDRDNKVAPESSASLFSQYRAVLPELLWSVQEKSGPPDRAALMRLLPALVQRLTEALKLIRLPDDECKEILDQMVSMHTQVLRANPGSEVRKAAGLEELRADFSHLSIHWERVSWTLDEPPQARADVIEEVFARCGTGAALNLGIDSVVSSAADREFLAQTYLLGTRVELHPDGGDILPAQLVWISSHRSLYLFRHENDATLAVYTSVSLLEALSRGTVVALEYAPVFERAVESLLFGAEKIVKA